MNKNILYPSRELKRHLSVKVIAISLVIITNTMFLITAHADDGATLHAENCIACHAAMTGGDGSVLYTRDDRNVMSMGSLGNQVNRCQSSLDLNWTNDQINNVQKYLNETFYKF
ncbi:MAG: cytochrome c [Gammaproteobacteria bacterium]